MARSIDDENQEKKLIEFLQEEYRKSTRVPTIKTMVAKKIVKNGKDFYKHFKSLQEACKAADVPAPLARIKRVENAVAKHKLAEPLTKPGDNGKPAETQQTNPEPVGNVVITDPTLAQLSKQVTDQELEAARTGSELELIERSEKAQRKVRENQKRIQTHKDTETAGKMRYNFNDYDQEMRRYYESHPDLQRRLHDASTGLGWGLDFNAHYAQIIRDQYGIFNWAATTLPEIWQRTGWNIDEVPVDANLASEQWKIIMKELEDTIDAKEYGRRDMILRNFKPNFRCPTDGTPLRHVQGVDFVCQRGHTLHFNCPECGSPLIYADNRFYCACLNRFLQ